MKGESSPLWPAAGIDCNATGTRCREASLKSAHGEGAVIQTLRPREGIIHGLVVELLIYGRALGAEELEEIPLQPWDKRPTDLGKQSRARAAILR